MEGIIVWDVVNYKILPFEKYQVSQEYDDKREPRLQFHIETVINNIYIKFHVKIYEQELHLHVVETSNKSRCRDYMTIICDFVENRINALSI